MKLLIMQLSPVFYYFLRLRPKYLSQHPILEYPLYSSLYVRDQVSHSYKATRKVTALFIVIIVFRQQTERQNTVSRMVAHMPRT
jgi:hypothetical protein